MISQIAATLAAPLSNLIDDLFTSDEERAAAKFKLLELQQKGELDKIGQQLSLL